MTSIDFAQVFDALPSPYMLLDRNLCYVTANPAYCETTGRTLQELQGKHLFDLFPNPGESGQRLRASFERVLAEGESDTLAYIHYPIPGPDGTMEDRYWTAVHTPLRDDDGNVAYIMQNTVDVTEFARLREAATLPYRVTPSKEASLLERSREATEAHESLLAESADFRRLFQQAPGFFAVLSGPDHVFTFASDSYSRLVGGRQVIGFAVREALPEVVEQGFVDLLDTVYRSGKPHAASGARVMLQTAEDEPLRETFLDFSYSPIRGPDGSIKGIFVQGTDQTEHVRIQRRQRLLLDELNHRVKNALATVQSIAAQSFRSTTDMNAARAAFEARIKALAATHSMLAERRWEDAELGALIRQELDPHGRERADIAGPYVVVGSKAAIGLTLVLHELTTNAAKYGALAIAGGSLEVRWRVESGRDLSLAWVERGVGQLEPSGRKGFGSRLNERVVTGELGGTIEMNYGGDGFSAALRIPATAYEGTKLEY